MPEQVYEEHLKSRIEDEKAALELIAVVGKLWFDKSIELIIFRNQMVDRSASELLQLHHYARELVRHPLAVHDTLRLAKAISRIGRIRPSRQRDISFSHDSSGSEFSGIVLIFNYFNNTKRTARNSLTSVN